MSHITIICVCKQFQQIWFASGQSADLITCKHPRDWMVLYRTLLSSQKNRWDRIHLHENAQYSGFEVSMYYSNTMKVLYQLVYLRSAGNRASSIRAITSAWLTVYHSGGLSSPHWFRMPSHKSRMRISTRLPLCRDCYKGYWTLSAWVRLNIRADY